MKTITLGNGTTMRFRYLPPDTFRMGQRGVDADEEPVHRVRIERGFWMAETAVTQAQFAAFKEDHKNHFAGKPLHPAESMSWHDAVAFCRWLTPKLPDGLLACLPTEAEWEYACRAGTRSEYYSGDGEDALKRVAWYGEHWGTGTHPVGSKGPESVNAFGLFDMHGNVWEWCFDQYDEYGYRTCLDNAADPWFKERDGFFCSEPSTEPRTTPRRIMRGGAWTVPLDQCHAAVRNWGVQVYAAAFVGFRLALVPGPQDNLGVRSPKEKSGAEDQSRRRRPERSEAIDDGCGGNGRSGARKQKNTTE